MTRKLAAIVAADVVGYVRLWHEAEAPASERLLLLFARERTYRRRCSTRQRMTDTVDKVGDGESARLSIRLCRRVGSRSDFGLRRHAL